jgi:glutamate dehydrogenase/leucine dehydrogenase
VSNDTSLLLPVEEIGANGLGLGASVEAALKHCDFSLKQARAERILDEKGTLVIPDFIVNAGGVICASVEYHGGTQTQVLQTIEEKIRANTEEVLANAKRNGSLPRQAAVELAETRVRKAMEYCRG